MSELTRKIDVHEVGGVMSGIEVIADARNPENGNASHNYRCSWRGADGTDGYAHVHFQDGPIKEHGINGITNEILLGMVIDRLEGFQSGPYACEENAHALASTKDALGMLQYRTKRRIERGVEGTHEK
jgi:hypothetical protein